MKKVRTFLMMLLLLSLLLAGCGEKTSPVTETTAAPVQSASQTITDAMAAEITVVETAIDNIGFVTPESEAKIELAEELYNQLSIEAKEQVGNAKTLTSARDTFDEMHKDINTVIDLIDAIGEVDISKGSIIGQAKSNYIKLSSFEQEYVDNYDVLVAAEEAYDALARQDAYDTFLAEFESEKATDALETAKEFLNSEYGPDFADQVNELCCGAYVKIAKYNYSNGYYQTALYYIDQCKELYAETETVSQIYAVEKSVWQTLADIEPENGEIVADTLGSGEYPYELDNSNSEVNTLVKMVSVSDESKYMTFYVRAGESAEVYIPAGEYIIKYADGETWYGKQSMFGQSMECSKRPEPLVFEMGYESDGSSYYGGWTTTHNVENGNSTATKIDPEDF